MADRITTIELEIEPSKVAEVAQEWAAKTKFSVHEKNEKRVLYLYNRHISTAAWLSIENLGTKAKLSAWIAPKGLRPDDKGSFWKGNKIALPAGFAIGPLGRYKKQFNRLLEMITSVSNDASVISTKQNANPQVLSKESFAKGLVVVSVILFLSGALSVYNGANLVNNQMFPDLERSLLQNGIVDMVTGAVLLLCSRLLKKGKALSIWLYGATLVFSIGQALIMGSNFPYLTIIFGFWIISQLLGLKKQGQLV